MTRAACVRLVALLQVLALVGAGAALALRSTAAMPGGLPCPSGVRLVVLPGACATGLDVPPETGDRWIDGSADAAPAALLCTDGLHSGPRLQVVYAHFGSAPDRLRSLRSHIVDVVRRANGVFVRSARAQGGYRSLRFAQSHCNVPSVVDVRLPVSARSNFERTIFELRQRGFTRTDRKYLVFADASQLCGIASVMPDDTRGTGNLNNSGPSYARVDNYRGCWAGVVAAHEIAHMLGAVQPSAPHATSYYHCTDGHDVMCYADGSRQAHRLSFRRCSPAWHALVLDCHDDDYFNLHPRSGSYLARHWDVAASRFLYDSALRVTLPGLPVALHAATARLQVLLTWSTASGPVTGYIVERDGQQVAALPATARSWVDSAPGVATTDDYSVAAVHDGLAGSAAHASVFVPAVPAPPSDLQATTDWSGTHLQWTDSAGATAYQVSRDGTLIATLPGSATTYDDGNASDTSGHTFTVVAVNVSGASGPAQVTVSAVDSLLPL